MVLRRRTIVVLAVFGLTFACGKSSQESQVSGGAQPSVAQFEQALDAQLQKLKPEGFTERTVLFQDVRAGKPKGGFFPFEVTAVIHDYGPGYPKNRYFGETCVGTMDAWKFDMLKDEFGKWIVQGRMTVTGSVCKNNPAAGLSSQPLAGLSGTRAPAAAPGDSTPSAAKAAVGAGSLYVGEYACYGTGGRLMAGMGFRLQTGGRYVDVDGGRGGKYDYLTKESTIAFRGGFLDGQKGTHVGATGFALSPTVSCEPWRP